MGEFMDDYLKSLDKFYLEHYGRSKRDGAKVGSGRYPLGSGKSGQIISSSAKKAASIAKSGAKLTARGLKAGYKFTREFINKLRSRYIERQKNKKLAIIRSGNPYAIRKYMHKMSDVEISEALKRVEQNTRLNAVIDSRSRKQNFNNQPQYQNNQQHNNQGSSGGNQSNSRLSSVIKSGQKFISDQIKETVQDETKFVIKSVARGQDPVKAIKIRNIKNEANRNKEFIDSLNNLRDSQKNANDRKLSTDVDELMKFYSKNSGVVYSAKSKNDNSGGKKNDSGGKSSIPKMAETTRVSTSGSTKKRSLADEFFKDFDTTPERVETVYNNNKSVRLSQLSNRYLKLRRKTTLKHIDQNGDFLAHYGVKGMRWRIKKGRTLYTDLRNRFRPYGSSSPIRSVSSVEDEQRPSTRSYGPAVSDRPVETPWVVQAIRTTSEGRKFILKYADKLDTVVIDEENFKKVRARGHKSINSILYAK